VRTSNSHLLTPVPLNAEVCMENNDHPPTPKFH
jgi:hypothetical protein